jgi:hypothetical protein
MKKIINKNVIFVLLSLIIAFFYILTVDVPYKETYNEVFAFLGFFVVLIPMIFSTKWKWGFLNSAISLASLIIIMVLWWGIKNGLSSGDFSFENSMKFSPVIINGIQGIILGIVLRFFYALSRKSK